MDNVTDHGDAVQPDDNQQISGGTLSVQHRFLVRMFKTSLAAWSTFAT